MAEGWDGGGRTGNGQEAEWAQLSQKCCSCFLYLSEGWTPSSGCALALLPILPGEEDIKEQSYTKGCVFPCLSHLERCSNKELRWCLLIPEGAAFGLLLAARARLCSAPAPLFSSSLYNEHHAPLSSSHTSCCSNPVVSNYLGKEIAENRIFQFGSPQIFCLQPPSITAVRGQPFCWGEDEFEASDKNLKITPKLWNWLLMEMMTSSRLHQIWNLRLNFQISKLVSMNCHTEMELNIDVQNRMWNKMNPLFHLKLLHGIPTHPGSEAMWETTEPQSWGYHGITTWWKPELYFLLQLIQSTGDLGHGKCFPWSSAFPNWNRCRAVLIHTCWGSMKKTKQLT